MFRDPAAIIYFDDALMKTNDHQSDLSRKSRATSKTRISRIILDFLVARGLIFCSLHRLNLIRSTMLPQMHCVVLKVNETD